MTKKELLKLIESSVNDIFLKYQQANNIESGDITPLQSLRLDDLIAPYAIEPVQYYSFRQRKRYSN